MSNKNLRNDIKVIQVNPKLRLFVLIFCNWMWFILLIALGGGWATWYEDIPFFQTHIYIITSLLVFFRLLSYFVFYRTNKIGIKFLPKNLREHYLQKNKYQLEKINDIKITNVTQLFNVEPICDEIYSKDSKTKEEKFIELSQLDRSKNRLVVNGKINNSDFSWGIVTKMKKNNLKAFLLTILYFNPLSGIFVWLKMPIRFNSVDYSKISHKRKAEYRKLGWTDLVAKNIGEIDSENYLIFSAKFEKQVDSITLIPKNNDSQISNLDSQYYWPANFSVSQKNELKKIIQEMSFLPDIYIYQDKISLVMKKYQYNEKDDNELQTWELLKHQGSRNDVQFNYLNNAIKIYNFFNKNSFAS